MGGYIYRYTPRLLRLCANRKIDWHVELHASCTCRRRSRHPQFDVGEQRSMICRTKLDEVTLPRVYNAHGAINDADDSMYYRTYESRAIPPPPPPGTAYCSAIHPDTATALCGPPSPTQTAIQLRHHAAAASPQPCDVVRGVS